MSVVFETLLLHTSTVSIRDIGCDGGCRHKGPLECAFATALVFPYRGTFVRHLGRDESVGENNQVLFFNRHQEYSISHPVAGGDSCISIAVNDETLHELAPTASLEPGPAAIFKKQNACLDSGVQALAATLRHGLRIGTLDTLAAESLALDLVRQATGLTRSPPSGSTAGARRTVDRAKLVLASDPGRRWTLRQIGREVGCSPVYLTQLFQRVEGIPLYRYQLQLRLANALEELTSYDDLTMLALDLGFSSHSHFSAAFRANFGLSPSVFRQQFKTAPKFRRSRRIR